MNITIFITFVTYWEIQVTEKTAKKNIYLDLYLKTEIALLEAISKTGFWFKILRYNQQDKKAGPRFNPPRLVTGSSTHILQHSGELKRGPNAETCPPHRKRHLQLAGCTKILFLR
jgi:hypothetical protein